jgi:hypothetical protein
MRRASSRPHLGPRRRIRAVLFALALGTLPGVSAQAPPAEPAAAQAPQPTPAEAKLAAYLAALEEAQPVHGLLNLWLKKDQLLLELGPEHLDHPYLMFPSLKTGIGQGLLISGIDIFDDWMIAFHRNGERIELLRVNARFYSSSDPQLGWVVDDGYGHSVAAALPILAENEAAGSVLVDLAGALFQDLPDLAGVLRWHFPFPYGLDPSRSTWGSLKAFPLNVEIDVQHTFMTDAYFDLGTVPDSRALPLTVRYSIVEPPHEPYLPRLADDRVGHFVTALQDISRPGDEEPFVRYVNRWKLEKANPAAARSAPRKPIVIYLEKSIPYQYRPAVRRGILEWNRAFEAIGIVDAIEVRFQPEDADWDAEDIRYSTIRWSTDAAFGGIGPIREDPRTGQIFDADILINSESLRGYSTVWRLYGSAEADAADGGEGEGRRGRQRALRLPPAAFPAATPEAIRTGGRLCMLSQGFAEQIGLGRLVLAASGAAAPGKQAPPELIEAAIKDLVMHEFGHVLGLRHNFKGSTAVPVEKLHDAAYTRQHGLSGSVMDYLAINVAEPGGEQGEFFPSTLGPYDYWAIEYGYKPILGASTPEDELEELGKIAARSVEPQLAYGTDEDFYGGPFSAADPYTNQFDLGSEPLVWARGQVELVTSLMDEKLLERVLEDGDRLQFLRRVVMGLLVRYYQATTVAARYVGGYDVTRLHKGQSAERNYLEPIDGALQRKALDFLGDIAFRDDRLVLPPRVLRSLPPETWLHWGSGPIDVGTADFPMQQFIELIRGSVLDRLLASSVLARVQNTELVFGDGAEGFTMAELMTRVSETVWSELSADEPATGQELVPRFRRSLQRRHLDRLIELALHRAGAPLDASSLARLELTELARSLDDALAGDSLGRMTQAHLEDCRRLIRQALEAKLEMPAP